MSGDIAEARIDPASPEDFPGSSMFGPRNDNIELEERDLNRPTDAQYEHPNTEPAAQQTNIATVEDIPPDGGYGWVVAAAVFLANAHTWGLSAAWGIFLEHYLTVQKFPGATNFQFALIGGLSISQALLVGPIVVSSQRRFGTRNTMLLGSLIIFAALISAGAAEQIWQLIVSQGIVFGFGLGAVYLPVSVRLLTRSPEAPGLTMR